MCRTGGIKISSLNIFNFFEYVCRYKLLLFVFSNRIFYFWSFVILCQMLFSIAHARFVFILTRAQVCSVGGKASFILEDDVHGWSVLHWTSNRPLMWGWSWKIPLLFSCSRSSQWRGSGSVSSRSPAGYKVPVQDDGGQLSADCLWHI